MIRLVQIGSFGGLIVVLTALSGELSHGTSHLDWLILRLRRLLPNARLSHFGSCGRPRV
jgi:hypothetical protein